MALDRAQVIKAAIDLLDEVGLDGLTLRRLAKTLDVQAPALYWHFRSKQELLNQMAATIAATEAAALTPVRGQQWDGWLADQAREMRASFNRHRDGAMLAASARPRFRQWDDFEERLGVLVDAGMTPAEALGAIVAVDNYVSGFALEEQADGRQEAAASPVDTADSAGVPAAAADYPRLTEALRDVGGPLSDRSFESGLRVILDGLRHRTEPP